MKTKHLKAAGAAVSLLIASGPALASGLWSRVSAGTGLARRGVVSRLRAPGVVVLLAVLAVSLPAGAVDDDDGGGGGGGDTDCLSDTTASFSVSPARVTVGESVTLRWSVRPAPGCGGMTQSISSIGPVDRSGPPKVVQPLANSSWTLFGRKGGGSRALASASVEVGYPPRVVIGPSTQNPEAVLLRALQSTNPQQTVELCDVDLDLTGHSEILIGDNRSLIASPACARGPRSFGPRIFVTDKRGSLPLFGIRGDNVRFSGFRLEGPTSGIAQGDVKEKGILIDPFAGAHPIRKIEISNMEIFHWSGVGVEVVDNVDPAERGRLFNTNPGAVSIRGNFFHHNRHGAGNGYGVKVGGGAYASIEQNVFDQNRHAIAGGSRNQGALDYSGYTARDNLILSGGGEHCSEHWAWTLTGWTNLWPRCWQTHQIDMHGDQNAWYSSHNWQCGTAGETMIIQRNTILYTSGHAIKIRGNPADKAVVDGNVFKDGDSNHAIAQNGACGHGDNITTPIDIRPNNVFGFDPTTELGSCDFFGDGQQDQFMATGVTWWAKSPVTQQWRYLNTMPERLPQLQLGNVDNDGKCDVAVPSPNPVVPPRKYSKNGMGPWVPALAGIDPDPDPGPDPQPDPGPDPCAGLSATPTESTPSLQRRPGCDG